MPTFEDKLLKNGSNSNVKNPSFKDYGKHRVISMEFELTSELAVNDVILGLKLPKNCLILEAKFKCPTMGATGIFSLGTVDDKDGLIASADAGGQAVSVRDGAASNLIGTVVGDTAPQLAIECLEITAAGIGKTIQAFVTVIVE